MRTIPLQSLPNQTFSVQIDQTSYDFQINACGVGDAQIMACTLAINNTIILTGERLVGGTPIIPYLYLCNGNFVLTTMNDDYPDYTKFGISQALVYASQAELSALLLGSL